MHVSPMQREWGAARMRARLWSHLQQLGAKHNLAALVYSCACKPSRPAHLRHHSCPQASRWHSARFLTHRPGPHLFLSFFLSLRTGPGGTKCDYTRSVSVCMPTETIAGQTAFMFAQGGCGHRT